jgi:hypothetical protein
MARALTSFWTARVTAPRWAGTRTGLGQILLAALSITLVQIAFAMLLSGKSRAADAYAALFQFDSGWFASILAQGYQCDLEKVFGEAHYECNVCFFPGYPLAAGLAQRFTGFGLRESMVLTAQLSCWGFWVYFLLLTRSWGLSARAAGAGALAILLFPSAFFLVVPYSEALFLMATVGYVYWCGRQGGWAWAFAALHGMIMTSTRFVGVALVLYPVMQELGRADGLRLRSWMTRRKVARLLLAGVSCLGVAAFFAYCQWRFGHWDLYKYAQQAGWFNEPSYLAVFHWKTYAPVSPIYHGELDPVRLDRAFAMLFLLWGLVLIRIEIKYRQQGGAIPDSNTAVYGADRLGLYFGALALFYLVVCSKFQVKMGSMTRLALPIHVFVVLATLHLWRSRSWPWPRRTAWVVALALVAICIQLILVLRFTRGLWVA